VTLEVLQRLLKLKNTHIILQAEFVLVSLENYKKEDTFYAALKT
jgi:hypothetical protein